MKKHDWTAASKARAKSFRAELIKLYPEQEQWVSNVSVTWEPTGYGRPKVPVYTIRHSDKHTAIGSTAAECIEQFVAQRVYERFTCMAPLPKPDEVNPITKLTAQQKHVWSQEMWKQARSLLICRLADRSKNKHLTVTADDLLTPRPTVDVP